MAVSVLISDEWIRFSAKNPGNIEGAVGALSRVGGTVFLAEGVDGLARGHGAGDFPGCVAQFDDMAGEAADPSV
ncbi:MAG: hypothetical protein WCS42_03805, partial [Verrucomicrobiota bacterium]